MLDVSTVKALKALKVLLDVSTVPYFKVFKALKVLKFARCKQTQGIQVSQGETPPPSLSPTPIKPTLCDLNKHQRGGINYLWGQTCGGDNDSRPSYPW